jgi:hypothetical protein
MNQIENYYMKQATGMPYFAGPAVQQGHGLGGIFGKLFRAVVPLFKKATPVLKSAAKTVAKEAARSGLNVISDVVDGESVQDALRNRSREGANRVVKKGVHRLDKMIKGKKTIKRGRRVRKHVDIFS